VVNNPTNTSAIQFSAIDPGPVIDPLGQLWTSWGSGYGKDTSKLQIWVTRLATTGLPLTSDPDFKPPTQLGYGLETGGIEASYIHYHDGYYYLFWNSGGCCSGASSTYEIHVARSQSITGPYGSARIFYASNGSIHGPGHIGVYDACGASRFTYHYYPDTGGSVLGENELSWGSDGFPVAGAPSTTPLKPCGQFGSSGSNGTAGSSGTGGASGAGGSFGTGGASGTSGTGGIAGTGGTAGSAGGGATGGAGSGTGGIVGTGGASGTGGIAATGGASGEAGSTVGGTGGQVGAAGIGGTPIAGSGGAAGGASKEASAAGGCTCELGPTVLGDVGAGLLLLPALVLVRRRSSRRF
jgi:hypothetical protein